MAEEPKINTEENALTETKQETERETQREGENLVSTNSLESKSVSVSCPVCGKPFTRETPKKAFNAVRGHFMGTKDGEHEGRFPYSMEDLGLVSTDETDEESQTEREEPTSEPRETIPPQRRVKPRKVRKAQPTWETQGEVPDSLTLLKNQLCLYGLNARNAIAVVDYMRSYHVDDIIVLNKALMDVGMSTSKRRMFLESWVNAREINIGFEVQEELRLFQRDDYVSAYDRMGMKIRPRERERVEERESNRQFNLGHQIGELTQMVKQLTDAPNTNSRDYEPVEDPRIDFLTDENKKLKDKLEDEAEKRHQAERQSDKAEFDAKLAKLESKDEKTMVLGKIDKSLTRLGDVGQKVVEGAIASEFPSKPPIRERVSGKKNSLLNLVPEEMVE